MPLITLIENEIAESKSEFAEKTYDQPITSIKYYYLLYKIMALRRCSFATCKFMLLLIHCYVLLLLCFISKQKFLLHNF